MLFVYLHKQKSAEDLEKEKLGHSIDISQLIKSIEDLSMAAKEINIEKKEVWRLFTFLTKRQAKWLFESSLT